MIFLEMKQMIIKFIKYDFGNDNFKKCDFGNDTFGNDNFEKYDFKNGD